jgi:DNA-binding MarR family transcriptional regulator
LDDWFRRDVRILEAVGQAEATGAKILNAVDLGASLKLEPDDVGRGVRALEDAGYIRVGSRSVNEVVFITPRLLERGRRELRLWPADGFDALVAVLELRISQESQPDQRSKLESFLAAVRSIGRDVAADVIGAVVKGAAGI